MLKSENIVEVTKELGVKYPIEATYNSRECLWTKGLKNKLVSEYLYNKARTYYGKLWTYVGD